MHIRSTYTFFNMTYKNVNWILKRSETEIQTENRKKKKKLSNIENNTTKYSENQVRLKDDWYGYKRNP